MIRGGALTHVALGLTVFLLLAVVHSQEKCSKTCIAQKCNVLGIRYGKYCGIGYFGCPGEPPCDDLDDCCMTHDNCVDLKGMTYVDCHKQFQRCVNELKQSIQESNNQKVGFSKECPYSTVIPTVYRGMNYGIFFSGIGNIIIPKKPASAGPVVEVDLARSKADTKDGLGTNQGPQTKDGSKVSVPMNPSPS
ncbi:Phospholipase A2-delta [Arabidopsis thaliana]|uniref:Phospholipase A2-delta n=3 Tax=Arabidopsis TaxID=3701 RepID=PLA2D_ARATH|nr:Phospholipase A2 family protein [Arabidopsis thaliana]NP_194676.2 Phospholipase A2 family protein [Arabidopsis thaliana]Q8GV50.1 RecName: Full=Phospholipase A2-delta; AltName: Full=Secretory phospholipase A2-delta; Short=AtsPLA2-delta; Flags: Precursor [Arabidopsis thaliana]KAG7617785.1 Phospholipase A2 domain superfamily [Arabidopsis thaliana x Arabidopsis arenosa]AAN63045.1 phospholipase A2 delta [Arabidopsis thaliana]AEE85635.1 Phospholipase A2 family protein [Arabidopsis thaliana]ANM66|eukprot:NP_001328472.1 Phospholipase A2 family protein [Arabidopsis thaliana]